MYSVHFGFFFLSLSYYHFIVPEEKKYKEDKSAATALGVLFALSFVGAAAGWFLYYRNRRGYSAV